MSNKRMTKTYHNATVIAEFKHDKDSLLVISELSNYMHKICGKEDNISTDLQSFPAGYRITFKISFVQYSYFKFRNKNYSKELAKVSDWLSVYPQTEALSRYHYNVNS